MFQSTVKNKRKLSHIQGNIQMHGGRENSEITGKTSNACVYMEGPGFAGIADDSPLSQLRATTTRYIKRLRRNSSSNPFTQMAASL